MTRLPRIASWTSLALAAVLCVAGCHSAPPAATDTSTTATPDQSQDPAQANLAPASYNTTPDTSAQAPAQDTQSEPAGSYDDSNYASQPVASAPEPPPAMPDYDQPPCPGDGYIWTPGYWGYQPTGYYWVPGVWTRAPYQGALWTPGYWGHNQNRYMFYPGHWGLHIGFYGGVNYGFGYFGTGYEGGYWDHDHFAYNRAINNINVSVVHNVYNYGNFDRGHNGRISFNGGNGGIPTRPQPVDRAAWREPVAPRMQVQVQHEQSFRNDRNQFVDVNHGHPANVVVTRPLEADREVRPSIPPQAQGRAVGHQMHPYGPPGQEKKAENPGHGHNPHDR